MRAVDEHGESHAFRAGRNLKATLRYIKQSHCIRREEGADGDSATHQIVPLPLHRYLTFLPYPTVTEPGDDGQSRQVHVPVVLILLLLLVMVMVIVFACEWYMYHYSSKPV